MWNPKSVKFHQTLCRKGYEKSYELEKIWNWVEFQLKAWRHD